jgi:DNA-binding NtrC family response regulator
MLFEGEGHSVDTALDGAEAVEFLNTGFYEIVITDLRMPRKDGLEILKIAKQKSGETEVILITAYASAQSAVAAMKLGAYDYVIKPFENDELLFLVNRILEKRTLIEENKRLRQKLEGRFSFSNIIGHSARLQEVFRLVEKVAGTSATVLLRGESGTGKELIAQAIHYNSSRKDKPFIVVNCGALPENLLESELFGHEKGAFTGAIARKKGFFELADQGTIFLDEVGDLSSPLQVKLLRVLQNKTLTRVGGTETIVVDVRVIAATNRDLEKARQENEFREDLFYRLNVFPIFLPPLRERMDDIEELTYHFLKKSGRDRGSISREAMDMLKSYCWRGNIRELENAVERATILAGDGGINTEHLPCEICSHSARTYSIEIPDQGIILEDLEKELLNQALLKAHGNKTRAAELLGITRRALYSRMERYGMKI